MLDTIPTSRIRPLGDAAVSPDGRYVLYWMTANRRARRSFALDRAAAWCRHLSRPLLVVETLRADYPWASERHHRFVLEGMADNAPAFAAADVAYHPYVELAQGAGEGLFAAAARQASVVVTDDYPLPTLALPAAAAEVRVEAVDGCGLVPLREPGRGFARAVDFRRWFQRWYGAEEPQAPSRAPLGDAALRGACLPDAVAERWPRATLALLRGAADALAALPIDHAVAPAPFRGGNEAARRALDRFVAERLARYADRRNHPDEDVVSGLSPYLHHGHVSAHDILDAVVAQGDGWSRERIGDRPKGAREGWWGLPAPVEAFLDQLITWRELSYVMAAGDSDPAGWLAVPAWARRTLEEHGGDPRPFVYDRAALTAAETHDPLWNAAQRQLLTEGRIHGYLRMLWGKNVLAWSETPQEALAHLVALNDRFALDGQDPISYASIAWVFGRYDRAWGPERPIFGKVRYMNSPSAHRKLRLRRYLERWSEPGCPQHEHNQVIEHVWDKRR